MNYLIVQKGGLPLPAAGCQENRLYALPQHALQILQRSQREKKLQKITIVDQSWIRVKQLTLGERFFTYQFDSLVS
jgi:hypothetical protein